MRARPAASCDDDDTTTDGVGTLLDRVLGDERQALPPLPTWGVSSAPLVDGDRLIAVVGAKPDGMVMAFDKRTGEERWRSVAVTGEMGYSQPVIYEAGGVRQLIVCHASALVSLDPVSGAMYWEQPVQAGAGMAIATPVKGGDYLLISQLYNGSTMLRLNTDVRIPRIRLSDGTR